MRIYSLSFSKNGRKTLNIDMLTKQLSIDLTLTIHDTWQMMENVSSMFVRCNGPQPPIALVDGFPNRCMTAPSVGLKY